MNTDDTPEGICPICGLRDMEHEGPGKTPTMAHGFGCPPRLAVDGRGFVWRVYDEHWSMAPVNPDNSPIPEPVTYYEPTASGDLSEFPHVEEALRLIDRNGCDNYTGAGRCLDPHSGRTRDARYGADRWCDPCIARAALSAAPLASRAEESLRRVTDPVDPVTVLNANHRELAQVFAQALCDWDEFSGGDGIACIAEDGTPIPWDDVDLGEFLSLKFAAAIAAPQSEQ